MNVLVINDILCSNCGFVEWLLLSSLLVTSGQTQDLLFLGLLASCSCWSLSAHLTGFNPVEWSFRTVLVTVARPNGADHLVCQREQGQLTLLVRTSLTAWAWCFWLNVSVMTGFPLQDGSTQWASADLGSNERKQKFLRLMGAGKVSFVSCRSLHLQLTVVWACSPWHEKMKKTKPFYSSFSNF